MSSKLLVKINKNSMEDFLKPLEGIQDIETPLYLFQQIQQKIESTSKNQISDKTSILLVASFLLLLSANIVFIFNHKTATKEETILTKVFQFAPDNNLYQ